MHAGPGACLQSGILRSLQVRRLCKGLEEKALTSNAVAQLIPPRAGLVQQALQDVCHPLVVLLSGL